MIVTRPQVVPATPEKIVEVPAAVTCDLCGETFKGAHSLGVGDGVNWKAGAHDRQCTSVEEWEGSVYPDSASYGGVAFDICPGCFKGKLIPWLREQGATGRETEVNW